MDEDYKEFCSKFEIADRPGEEDRESVIEAIARLLISMAENFRQGDVA